MRFRRRVGLVVLFAFAGGLAVDAADPATPGKLTPAQKEKLKEAAKSKGKPGEKLKDLTPEQRAKLKEKLKDLTPEQKQKVKDRLKDRAAEKKAEPSKPSVPAKPAPPKAAVRPVGEVVQVVDAAIAAKLSAEKVTASPRADDAEFLRRVSLDLTGVIPTANEARAFLDSTDADKRAQLVDRLLESPRFGQHQADIWTAKLLPRLSDNRFVERQPFTDWVASEFNKGTPWDQFTTKLLTATGSGEDNPAATFFQANRSADKLTDAVGTHFLGVQIACAQCHNHPYTEWKQTDYWGVAAFFEKVAARPPLNPKVALLQKEGAPKPGVTELAGRSRVKDFFPESAKQVPPKFLGDSAPILTSSEPYRPALAEWLTSGRSPFFAQAFVNRAWAQLFSRGLVDPVDDLDPTHPATHPEAFALLSEQFRATGYDVKRLYRTLALTDAYQRSSKPTAGNKMDKTLYSHMAVKVLSPEQLFDSLAAVVPMPGQTAPGKGAAKAAGGVLPRAAQQRDQFVQFFLAGAEMANAAEYEAGIPQALRLMNSRLVGNPKAAQAFAGFTLRQTVETMYLATLSRRPTDAEVARATAYHAENGPTAAADVLWALINSSEFALVR